MFIFNPLHWLCICVLFLLFLGKVGAAVSFVVSGVCCVFLFGLFDYHNRCARRHILYLRKESGE